MSKDYNRSKIIEAETAVYATLSNYYKREGVPALEAHATRTGRTAWFKRRNLTGNQHFEWCRCSSVVNTGHYTRLDLAHSMAHQATGPEHGVAFVKAYLDLVQHFLSIEYRRILKAELVQRNVKTKEVSEATKAKMRENWARRNIKPDEAKEGLQNILADLQKWERK